MRRFWLIPIVNWHSFSRVGGDKSCKFWRLPIVKCQASIRAKKVTTLAVSTLSSFRWTVKTAKMSQNTAQQQRAQPGRSHFCQAGTRKKWWKKIRKLEKGGRLQERLNNNILLETLTIQQQQQLLYPSANVLMHGGWLHAVRASSSQLGGIHV